MLIAEVKLTFTTECLGTLPANPDIFEEFIASKREAGVDPEEVESLPSVAEDVQRGTTVFARDENGKPHLWNYQVQGFLKEACGGLQRVDASEGYISGKLRAYKKIIDSLVFVFPRRILLVFPEGKEWKTPEDVKYCVRPLRAKTPQGERVSLIRSEMVPTGTQVTFTIELLDSALLEAVEEWLDYGKYKGISQWRNSGKGRFIYTLNILEGVRKPFKAKKAKGED